MEDRSTTFYRLLLLYSASGSKKLPSLIEECNFDKKDKMILQYIVQTSSKMFNDVIVRRITDLEFIVEIISETTGLDTNYLKKLFRDLLKVVDKVIIVDF